MKSPVSASLEAILILLTSFCLLMISCGREKTELKGKNDLDKYDLKGRVRSCTELYYSAVAKSGQTRKHKLTDRTTLLFDRAGKIIKSENFRLGINLTGGSIFEYDARGNIVEKKEFDGNGQDIRRITYTYDTRKNLIKIIDLNLIQKSEYKDVFTYNNEGRAAEQYSIFYGREMPLYFLGEDGVARRDTIRRGNHHWQRTAFSYDGSGNRIEERSYDNNGHVSIRRINKFDARGNLIETNVFNRNDKLIWKDVYVYNETGNLLEEKWGDSDSAMETTRSCTYDETGNIKEEMHYLLTGRTKSIYEYAEVDKHGNWLARTERIVSVKTGKVYVTSIMEREIKYCKWPW